MTILTLSCRVFYRSSVSHSNSPAMTRAATHRPSQRTLSKKSFHRYFTLPAFRKHSLSPSRFHHLHNCRYLAFNRQTTIPFLSSSLRPFSTNPNQPPPPPNEQSPQPSPETPIPPTEASSSSPSSPSEGVRPKGVIPEPATPKQGLSKHPSSPPQPSH